MSFSYISSVVVEAIIVGIVLAVSLSVSDVLVPINGPQRAAYTGLVVGMLVHVGFEVFGANRWYCKQGASCKRL
jgi:hypothetical protein